MSHKKIEHVLHLYNRHTGAIIKIKIPENICMKGVLEGNPCMLRPNHSGKCYALPWIWKMIKNET